ncbi:MAG: ATP-binding cassette domain-containing protein [Gammaproteobacteria bacterium]|nr:ABC transporter ATP-binding protein [Gammaproteobacteria bacterium]NIP87786.1 ABC transporter ATP-binding protein [Gammaproteobacteria bacterium]NIR22293.1 ABC transporter ATP-binding protein [Gammaproteobacteria bacterium]NIS03927.1 ABC transporter ATP-binding protein [Gammaproteobacteria bacterium]NIU41719.1 ATP-binding cassette domain-containing protein [Gammaproteobacteria bacterium]
MLRISDIQVSYGDYQVIWGVSLEVREGEVVSLLGPNGSGKSTVFNTISGLLKPHAGSIEFTGRRIDGQATHDIVRLGLAHILERRRVFPYLTVRQNLWLGGYHPDARAHRAQTLAQVYDMFPRLRERQTQLAHSLSGGEQQMLALGRGLMSRPRLLMVDEPFLGLAPAIVEEMKDAFARINADGVSILFIEQNVQVALNMSSRGYILESGRLALAGTSRELLESAEVKRIFLGG